MSDETVDLACLCNHCSQRLEFPSEGVGTEIQCPTCGMTTRLYREQVATSITAAPAQPIMSAPAPASHFQCPRCSSPEIQSFPMLHMSGISRTSAFGIASDGEIGGMSANTQSLLSTLAAPPKERGKADGIALAIIGWIVGGIIGGLFSAGLIAFLIFAIAGTAGGIVLHRSNAKWNKWEYPPLYRKWKHSWLCKRCGTTWHQPE